MRTSKSLENLQKATDELIEVFKEYLSSNPSLKKPQAVAPPLEGEQILET